MKKAINPFQEAQHLDVKHWLTMMGRVDNVVVARLLLKAFEEHPQMRDAHMGTYLRAAETVKRDHIRYAKSFALGRSSRLVALMLFRALAFLFAGVAAVARSSLNGIRCVKAFIDQRRATSRSVLVVNAVGKSQSESPAWRRCAVRPPRADGRRIRTMARARV